MTTTGHEVGRRLACHLCKRSKAKRCVKLKKWCTSLQKDWNLNSKSRENERHLLKPPLNSPGFPIVVFFCTSKMEKLFGGNLATCYSLYVTQIFYNTYCVVFFVCFFPLDIGPQWRPALTHQLITWFIHIYKNLWKAMYSSKRFSSQISSCTKRSEIKRKKKTFYLLKASFRFAVKLRVKESKKKKEKNKSEQTCRQTKSTSVARWRCAR